MKTLVYLFSFAVLVGCSQEKASEKTANPSDSLSVSSKGAEANPIGAPEPDCVFDTNSYAFSTAPIKKYDPALPIVWKEGEAIAALGNGDTLILRIGGCNHFGFSATLRTEGEKIADSVFLMEKSIWLAKTFFTNGFDTQYEQYIRARHFALDTIHSDAEHQFYNITDTTMAENEVFDGMRFFKDKNRTEISLSGYVN